MPREIIGPGGGMFEVFDPDKPAAIPLAPVNGHAKLTPATVELLSAASVTARRADYGFGEGEEGMSAMDTRVQRLEIEAAARKPLRRHLAPLIAQKDGETAEQAVARWKAAHPWEAAPDGQLDCIILVPIFSPNSREAET